MINEMELRRLLVGLLGRIASDVAEGVVDELDAGEPAVAVEWLCDSLFEDEVRLSSMEVETLAECVAASGSRRYTIEELRELSGS